MVRMLPEDSSQLIVLFKTALPESSFSNSRVPFQTDRSQCQWLIHVQLEPPAPFAPTRNNSKCTSQLQSSLWTIWGCHWDYIIAQLQPLSNPAFLPFILPVLSFISHPKIPPACLSPSQSLLLGKCWDKSYPENSKRGSVGFNLIWENRM